VVPLRITLIIYLESLSRKMPPRLRLAKRKGIRMASLKIVKCDDEKKWYSSLVGELVPFAGDTGAEYESREPEGYINFISKGDCILIED